MSLQEGKGISSVEAHRACAKTSPLKSTKSPVPADSGLGWLLRGLDPVGSACFTEMHHYTQCLFIECPPRCWHCNYLFLRLCITLLWFFAFSPCKDFVLAGDFIFLLFSIGFPGVRRGNWLDALCIQSCKATAQDFKHFSDFDNLPLQVKLFSLLDLLQVGREGVLQQCQIAQSLQVQND